MSSQEILFPQNFGRNGKNDSANSIPCPYLEVIQWKKIIAKLVISIVICRNLLSKVHSEANYCFLLHLRTGVVNFFCLRAVSKTFWGPLTHFKCIPYEKSCDICLQKKYCSVGISDQLFTTSKPGACGSLTVCLRSIFWPNIYSIFWLNFISATVAVVFNLWNFVNHKTE